jgi:hypothetical protein
MFRTQAYIPALSEFFFRQHMDFSSVWPLFSIICKTVSRCRGYFSAFGHYYLYRFTILLYCQRICEDKTLETDELLLRTINSFGGSKYCLKITTLCLRYLHIHNKIRCSRSATCHYFLIQRNFINLGNDICRRGCKLATSHMLSFFYTTPNLSVIAIGNLERMKYRLPP